MTSVMLSAGKQIPPWQFVPRRNDKYLRNLLLVGILVDTSSGFLSQPSCLNILNQQWCRLIFFTQSLVQVVEDMETSVEADQIHQVKRPHGMVQSQLQSFINIFCRGNSSSQHVERFI